MPVLPFRPSQLLSISKRELTWELLEIAKRKVKCVENEAINRSTKKSKKSRGPSTTEQAEVFKKVHPFNAGKERWLRRSDHAFYTGRLANPSSKYSSYDSIAPPFNLSTRPYAK